MAYSKYQLESERLSASGSPSTISQMIDGNIATSWIDDISNATNRFIMYDFGTQQKVARIRLALGTTNSPKNITIEASNDGSVFTTIKNTDIARPTIPSWVDVDFEQVSYRYWKVTSTTTGHISSAKLQYLEFELYSKNINKILISSGDKNVSVTSDILKTENSIPLMTSNVAPSGQVIYSTQTSGYEAYKVFNKSNGNDWSPSSTLNEYVGYKFPTPKIIYKYILRRGTHVTMTYSPISWTFEASNDGVNYTILDRQTNHTWTTASQEKEFTILNNKKFLYYRLFVQEGGNTTVYYIGELLMFEKSLSFVKEITTSIEQNFINHGMDKPTELDLNSEINNKIFIEQSPTTLGDGKVFKKSIDTSQIPIKKVTIE